VKVQTDRIYRLSNSRELYIISIIKYISLFALFYQQTDQDTTYELFISTDMAYVCRRFQSIAPFSFEFRLSLHIGNYYRS
jgi:hypothetical protein